MVNIKYNGEWYSYQYLTADFENRLNSSILEKTKIGEWQKEKIKEDIWEKRILYVFYHESGFDDWVGAGNRYS